MSSPNRPPLARILLRGTVWTSLGSYLMQALGFGATLVLTRLLREEIFGYFTMASFWSSLLNLRAKAGLNYAAIRQPATSGKLLGTFMALDVALGLASVVLSSLVALLLPHWGYPPEVVIGLLVLIGVETLAVVVGPFGIVLERELQVSRLTLVSLVGLAAAYAVAIPLALSGGGLWSLLAINVVAGVVSTAGVYLVCRQRLPAAFQLRWQFDLGLAKQLARQGLTTGLSLMALATIVTQFDNFLIGTFAGYATAGLYDRAYRIASWPNVLVTTVVSRIGFLAFSKVQNDPLRLAHAVRLSLWALAVSGIPMALGLVFGARDIVGVLYGERWLESAGFLRYLSIYSLTWPFVSVGFWLSAALGHSHASLKISLAPGLTLVVVGTPLTMAFGVPGTLAAVALTMVVAFSASNIYIFRHVPLTLREIYLAPVLAGLAALAPILGVQFIPAWSAMWPIGRLFATGIIVGGVFASALYLLQPSVVRERVRYLRELWSTRQPTI